ncbi:MAG: Gfo/Idh/MocA family oxidoreductase [PVC group bacterium]
MPDTLHWGILSTARINRRIIPPLRRASRSEPVAVAGRDPDRTRDFAARWGIGEVFPSYRELLACPGIDAVYIPLPNSLHCEWVVRTARAGKHVLCEKPLSLTAAEAEKMASAARENGVVLLEAMAYRMHPQFLRLQSLIGEGMIGRIGLIRAWFRFTLPAGENFRWSKEMGGGVLRDVGCYPVNFCRAVAGSSPETVYCRQLIGPTGVDILSSGQLTFPGGLIAQIDCAFSLPFGVGAEVIGEKGVLRLPNPWQPDIDGKSGGLIHIAPDDTETSIPVPAADPYLCEIEAMESAVLDGVPPLYTVEESRENAAAIAALYRSARSGRPVNVTTRSISRGI